MNKSDMVAVAVFSLILGVLIGAMIQDTLTPEKLTIKYTSTAVCHATEPISKECRAKFEAPAEVHRRAEA